MSDESFYVTAIAIPKGANPAWDAARVALAALSREELEEHFAEAVDDYLTSVGLTVDSDEEFEATVRAGVAKDIATLELAFEADDPALNWIEFAGHRIYLAGGTYEPSDLFCVINRLSGPLVGPVLSAAGFVWQTETETASA